MHLRGATIGQSRRRPNRISRVAVVFAATLMALMCAPSWQAAAVDPSSALSEATAASSDSRQLRREVASTLGGYLSTYGDRFTSSETIKLKELTANTDRQLGFVVLATNRLRWSIAKGATDSQIKAVGKAAQATQKRARTTAETSFDQARVIVEPKLSLFERLQALSDYNSMLDRFDALGEQLTAIAKLYQ